MKYNSNNKPIVCMQTNSTCYKNTSKMNIKGVLWHSTGAKNPWIKRYVQPSDNAPDKEAMLKLIGKNEYCNDWNHIYLQAGLNAWIGKLADGTVATVQTMPWDYKPWGCGSGSKGSCNNGFVQFEICEDSLNDKAYFNKVYKEACELTAYVCKTYNLDPNGFTTVNGVKVPVILCHADSYKLGLGSNHGDVLHWFKKHGKNMDNVRKDVAALMNIPVSYSKPIETLVEKGIINSPDYWVEQEKKNKNLDALLDKLANAVQSKKFNSFNDPKTAIQHIAKCGVIDSPKYWESNYSKTKYLDALLINAANHIQSKFPYKVKVTTDSLNIRKGAGTLYGKVGVIEDGGVYTIVDEKTNGSTKWGLLKSYEKNRNGWISLKYCTKI